MRKRTIMALAAGVVAGATVVGVPAFAYAGNDSGGGMSGSDMGSMMGDPASLQEAKIFVSGMMSDPTLQKQMRSMMGGMGDMSGMAAGDDPGNP